MQVVGTATPPVPRLGYLARNRAARAQPQVSGCARARYSVTYGRRGERVHEGRFPRSWEKNTYVLN